MASTTTWEVCYFLLAAALRTATAQAQTRDSRIEVQHESQRQRESLSQHTLELGEVFSFVMAMIACLLVCCMCLALAAHQLLPRMRPQAETTTTTKRRQWKPVRREAILEHMPPAKAPRAPNGDQPNCVVCLCEVGVDEDSITTQCGHIYHKECVLQWWTHKPRRCIRCPTCRTKQVIRPRCGKQDSLVPRKASTPSVEEGPAGAEEEQDSWLPDLEAGLPQRGVQVQLSAPALAVEMPPSAVHQSVRACRRMESI